VLQPITRHCLYPSPVTQPSKQACSTSKRRRRRRRDEKRVWTTNRCGCV
jgi:hypothetical protein